MKLKIAAAAILATAIITNGASAKTLEDVLKEKGVITEDDYKEVTKVKPIDYKLGKGFTFTTADEKFQLSLGGRFQIRYTFNDKDGAAQDSSVWEPKQVKFYLNGYAYSKDLTYGLQANFAKGNTPQILDDAWLNYRFINEVQLKAGQFKTPFARQELISDANQQFVDRSIVVDAFKQGRDIGALLNGKIADGLLYYNVGVYGGLGQSVARATNDNLFAARVAVNPLGDVAYTESDLDYSKKPLLSIGANYFRNTLKRTTSAGTTSFEGAAANNASSKGWLGSTAGRNFITTADNQKVDVDSYGTDAVFKWRGISVQGEYLLGQAENHSNGKLLRAHGFYTQAGYTIIPGKLEAAIRYSYLDPNRDVTNDHQIETIGAVSYYFDKHNLKVQTDVGNIHTQGNQTVAGQKIPTDDMQYRVQAQITF